MQREVVGAQWVRSDLVARAGVVEQGTEPVLLLRGGELDAARSPR